MTDTPPAGLVLRLPRLDEEAEFLRAHHATTPDTPSFLHGHTDGMPFPAYLQWLRDQARGIGLAKGDVPATFVFAFAHERIVGRVSIRHRLNPFLLQFGGHIGYAIVPEFRRRGHATALLALAVAHARDTLAIGRVLVTCDDDNIGSIQVIERNHGVLENRCLIPGRTVATRRYWISTAPA